MNPIDFEELAHNFLKELGRLGYPEKTLQMYRLPLEQISALHKSAGQTTYNQEIADHFVESHRERYESGKIRKGTYHYYKRAADRLGHYFRTGNMEMPPQKKTPPHTLYFESILDTIRTDEMFSGGEHNHFVSLANRYFTWLTQKGINSLNEVSFDAVREYIHFCSENVNGNTLAGIKRRLRILHGYFVAEGYTEDGFSMLLSLPVAVEKRILPAMSHDEVYSMPGCIDQTTKQGKMEYAVILLGFVTGLRACDMARMKLSDIDWTNGEIRIYQSKTGNALSLPLTVDIGNALQRYILEARPESRSERIFLQAKTPHREYRDGTAFSQAVEGIRKRAGLPTSGFHGLRRAAGRNMAVAGVPVTTVSQVPGHSSVDITKQYISLDTVHLKECALSISGIVVGGGGNG